MFMAGARDAEQGHHVAAAAQVVEVEVEDISRTSLVTILSSAHGRQRRGERNIVKPELQAAVKYGVREAQIQPRTGARRWKYTFAGIVYITDSQSRREITSWPEPCFGFDVPLVRISTSMAAEHDASVAALERNLDAWTSHTVIVVDQSGSMRNTDVDGGATRSDAVWLTLALTWVGDEIRAGNRKSTDVVSIVSMRDSSTLLVDRKPVDWLLYNALVEFLRSSKPAEGGNYAHAIDLAEECLMRNTRGACALALLFLSDGVPSDPMLCAAPDGRRSAQLTPKQRLRRGGVRYCLQDSRDARDRKLSSRIGELASRFGRRLTFGTIGFANPSDEFSTLQSLTKECVSYGCQASFHKPALTAQSLQQVLSNISSTLTSSKTEMTSMDGSRQRTIRDVMREPHLRLLEDLLRVNNEDWRMYSSGLNDYVKDRVTWVRGWLGHSSWMKLPTFTHENAVGMAMRNKIFGEGAERMVSNFREYDINGTFVGPWMVAKESRFIEDLDNRDLKRFHRAFCETQQTASRIANAFNRQLATIPGVDASTPQIQFLECSVYMLHDQICGKRGVLVEKRLDPKRYKKWNSNNGYVDGMRAETDDAEAIDEDLLARQALGAIDEGEEEEEEMSDSESDEEFARAEEAAADTPSFAAVDHVPISFTAADIPQAFSCFSHLYSNRRYLVCDLQGVLDETSSPPCFELTDPVIHHNSKSGRRNKYGRTDRGLKGISSFFKTHVCSELCDALKKKWIDPQDVNGHDDVAVAVSRQSVQTFSPLIYPNRSFEFVARLASALRW